eukprot:1430132-Pyramimonas_sp.AAC.1
MMTPSEGRKDGERGLKKDRLDPVRAIVVHVQHHLRRAARIAGAQSKSPSSRRADPAPIRCL